MAKHDWQYDSARTAIRETATELFRQNGVYATSLGDIAGAIHLSKGTLYYYYPSKEYLIQDIAELHLAGISDRLFAWLDGLRAGMEGELPLRMLLEELLSDENLIRLHLSLTAEAARSDGELRARFQAKEKEWAVILQMGALKVQSSETAFLGTNPGLLYAVIEGAAQRVLMGNEPDTDGLCRLFLGLSS